jgi:hypothetical protein
MFADLFFYHPNFLSIFYFWISHSLWYLEEGILPISEMKLRLAFYFPFISKF